MWERSIPSGAACSSKKCGNNRSFYLMKALNKPSKLPLEQGSQEQSNVVHVPKQGAERADEDQSGKGWASRSEEQHSSLNDPRQMGPSQQTPTVSFDSPGLNIHLYRSVTWVGAPQTRQPQEKCLRMSGINPRLIEILSHPLPPQPSFSEWRFKKQIKFDYEEKMTLHLPHIRVVDQYSCLATHRDWWCGPQVLNRKAVFPSCLPAFLTDWLIDWWQDRDFGKFHRLHHG